MTPWEGSLRERRFRLLFLARSISLFGDKIAPVALAFAVLKVRDSPGALGVVLAAQTVPQVLFLLIGGAAGDRLSPPRVMVLAETASAVAQAASGVLVIMEVAQLWQLLVLQTVHGFSAAFFRPASTAAVPLTVKPDDVQQANAVLGVAQSVAAIAGPATAGAVVTMFGPGIGLVIDSATFAVSALCLMPLIQISQRSVAVGELLSDVRDGWQEFISTRWLWTSVLYFSVVNALYLAPVAVVGPVIARQTLGGAAGWAIIVTAAGVGGIAGSMIALRHRPRYPLQAMVSVGWFSLLQVGAFALLVPLALVATAGFVGGMAMGYGNTLWFTALHRHVRRDILSRVSAYDWLGSVLFFPIGALLAGAMTEIVGISPFLWLCAGTLSMAMTLVLRLGGLRAIQESPALAE